MFGDEAQCLFFPGASRGNKSAYACNGRQEEEEEGGEQGEEGEKGAKEASIHRKSKKQTEEEKQKVNRDWKSELDTP